MRAQVGMLLRGLACFAVAACSYADFPEDTTTFKCDDQNPCPADQFCSDRPRGVCIATGSLGCFGQELSRWWGFETGDEAWNFYIDTTAAASLSFGWTPEMGNPEPGALELSIGGTLASRRLGWIRPPDGPLGDMRGKVISARVWTDQPGLKIRAYVVNNTSGAGWTDGGIKYLEANMWECVRLKIDEPGSTMPSFDPTAVYQMGLQLEGPAPAHIVIDDVGY